MNLPINMAGAWTGGVADDTGAVVAAGVLNQVDRPLLRIRTRKAESHDQDCPASLRKDMGRGA